MMLIALTLPRAKSESDALIEVAARVSARNVTKCGTLAPNRAFRSTPTRRNSPAWGEVKPNLSRNCQGTDTGSPLTRENVDPAGVLSGVRLPESSVPVQR